MKGKVAQQSGFIPWNRLCELASQMRKGSQIFFICRNWLMMLFKKCGLIIAGSSGPHRLDPESKEMEIAEELGGKFETNRLENGDTEKQLLNSSRYLLFKSEPYWTPSQTHNTEILFNRYPALGKLCMKFSIFQKFR